MYNLLPFTQQLIYQDQFISSSYDTSIFSNIFLENLSDLKLYPGCFIHSINLQTS